MRGLLIWFIRLYQRTLSPDHGYFRQWHPQGYCRFHPTCSMYAIGALEKYGSLRGSVMALWRVLRCHPWAKGGEDPVR
ncbi:membrane protein insertion efficiency factor YidD [Candidatus Gracilibacteria bacterium CG17_big_fil_post_rev_8_21_14_2_50_48_13]|nr:MAG: membrane protein insertion efficiency factor YidD [Candidatus Gracilibacteria bacterium CG17_big_fil_post_rev_8_21_14_2_50_48_13]